MLENIYGLFDPINTDYETWYSSGFLMGFVILVTCCLSLCFLYYIIIGRWSRKYATMGWWFSFMTINVLLVFTATALLCGMVVFENRELSEIPSDIWVFAIWNSTLYTILLYSVLSVSLNNMSLYNRYIPFNLFR